MWGAFQQLPGYPVMVWIRSTWMPGEVRPGFIFCYDDISKHHAVYNIIHLSRELKTTAHFML
jgi:hypothetical protein